MHQEVEEFSVWDKIIGTCAQKKWEAIADLDLCVASFWRDNQRFFTGWQIEEIVG